VEGLERPCRKTSKSTAVNCAGGDDGEKREGGVGGDEEAGEQEGEAHQPGREWKPKWMWMEQAK
jgi:hypothetical protein